MTNKMATNQRAQYLDVNGNPLSMGRVTFLDVGTDNEKSIFADPDLSVELANPVLLDIGGFVPTSSIFYGEGNYSVLVEHVTNPGEAIPDYDEEYLVPIVVGSDSAVPTGNVINISSVEELVDLDMGTNSFVHCSQYYNRTVFDQGGGLFKWYPSSTSSTDLGMTFAWSGSPAIGRFWRIGDGETIKTSWFGLATDTGSSMNNRIIQAAAYCNDERPILEFTEAEIEIQGTVNVATNGIKINSGVIFKQSDSNFIAKIVFTAPYIDVVGRQQSMVKVVSGSVNVVFINTTLKMYPEWWGALGNNVNNDYTSFRNASESTGKLIIENSYLISGIGAGGATDIIFKQLHLIDSGYLLNNIDSITVEKCTSNTDAYWNFRTLDDDYSVYVFNNTGMKGQWLMDSEMTDAHAISAIDAVKTDLLIWDKPGIYGIDKVSSVQRIFNNKVEQGVTFKFTSFGGGNGNIGFINAGQYRIFEDDSETPTVLGPVILGAWFGANSFAESSVIKSSIEKAIIAGDDCTVDFGGCELKCEELIYLDAVDNCTVKNLNLKTQTLSTNPFLMNNCKVKFVDCTFAGMKTTGDGELEFYNCNFYFNINSTVDLSIELDGRILILDNCVFKHQSQLWEGNLELFDVSQGVQTDDLLRFTNNTITGGTVDILTPPRLGTLINDNLFNNIRLENISTDRSFMKIRGGSHATIKDNTFVGEELLTGTAKLTFIEFIGNSESVIGLYCDNNMTYIGASGSNQRWANHSVSGYADDGHKVVIPNNIIRHAVDSVGTNTRGNVKSATGTGTFTVNLPMIFPYRILANQANGNPYCYVLGSADGFTTSTNGLGFYYETVSMTGSGGNCVASILCQLRSSTGYNITQVGQMYVSVESAASYDLN